MARSLSITIRIGSRTYPLSVSPEEEELLRQSAKTLNQRLQAHQKRFNLQHTEDLLSMVAFDLMVEHDKRMIREKAKEQALIHQITTLQALIDSLSSAEAPSPAQKDTKKEDKKEDSKKKPKEDAKRLPK